MILLIACIGMVGGMALLAYILFAILPSTIAAIIFLGFCLWLVVTCHEMLER